MKPFFESKTLWFNFLSIIILLAGQDFFVSIGLSAKIQVAILTIGNAILRFFTNNSIVDK